MTELPQNPQRLTFTGGTGHELAARIDLPAGPARAFALFAHCFTGSKDIHAARRIGRSLAQEGIGVFRFDFTGLGHSDGDFTNTNFSSNVQDLLAAAAELRSRFEAPSILIGHSLGGAAALTAASSIPEVKAVATIGTPSEVERVLDQLGPSLEEVREKGEAKVNLAGRHFRIQRHFVEDAESHQLTSMIADLKKPLLILHAPRDETVNIKNATAIFAAAEHPKSFVSLDDADHLLTRSQDASYAATVIAAWAERFIASIPSEPESMDSAVVVSETGQGNFQNTMLTGRHRLLADEPISAGGLDTGPSPYDYLSAALGACTAVTLRLYAMHRKLNLPRITVRVDHGKFAAEHCADCRKTAEGHIGKVGRFERVISVKGGASSELSQELIEIAEKCPVHRTLETGAAIVTRVSTDGEQDTAPA